MIQVNNTKIKTISKSSSKNNKTRNKPSMNSTSKWKDTTMKSSKKSINALPWFRISARKKGKRLDKLKTFSNIKGRI